MPHGSFSSPTNSSPPPHESPPSLLHLEEDEPLLIQSSLVSIAYNYQKRKNVFRVTTCNGSEYLFQVSDNDSTTLAFRTLLHYSNQ